MNRSVLAASFSAAVSTSACCQATDLLHSNIIPLSNGSVMLHALAQESRAADTQEAFSGRRAPEDFPGARAPALALFAASREGPFNAPYFAMVHGARYTGVGIPAGQDGRLRLGVLSATGRHLDVLPSMTVFAKRTLISAEYEHRSGRAVALFSIGLLRESGSLLGSMHGNELAHKTSARTAFSSISLAYALTPRLSLVGMAAAGRSSGVDLADGTQVAAAGVRTVAYSMGLSARRLWRANDRLSLTLTVPTMVTHGATGFGGAVSQRDDGSLAFSTRTLNLAPSATERDLEMTYARELGRHERVAGTVLMRLNPGHDAATPRQLLIGVRYGRRF
jgi:hypothetical protein